MLHDLGATGQVGYIVDDLLASVQKWYDTTGIGPWYVKEHVPLDYFTYRGKPSDIDIGIAYAYTGSMQIELITQHNDAPSMYMDFRNTQGEGAQHVCFFPSNYDAAMHKLLDVGMTNVQDGAIQGIRFMYLSESHGQVIEIADFDDRRQEARQTKITAALEWDGKDLIRT